MFDGEETTACVVLITNGVEIYAIPVTRTGDLSYEAKVKYAVPVKLQDSVAHVLILKGTGTHEK